MAWWHEAHEPSLEDIPSILQINCFTMFQSNAQK